MNEGILKHDPILQIPETFLYILKKKKKEFFFRVSMKNI